VLALTSSWHLTISVPPGRRTRCGLATGAGVEVDDGVVPARAVLGGGGAGAVGPAERGVGARAGHVVDLAAVHALHVGRVEDEGVEAGVGVGERAAVDAGLQGEALGARGARA
jgi:hypothetical protein